MKKAKQAFYWFYMLKTHLQISYKPVAQACHDFKIFMHSKGKEINFKFLFIQFRFVKRAICGKRAGLPFFI